MVYSACVLVYAASHQQRGIYFSALLCVYSFPIVFTAFDIVFHQRRYMAFHSVN